MNTLLGRGVHATSILWPGFTTDPWPQDFIDFFGGDRQNIIPSIIQANWVGDAETGHYVTIVKTPNGWAPLPDGAYLVKFTPNGALYAYDPDTYNKAFRLA